MYGCFCPDLNSVAQSLVVTEDSEASLAAILQHSFVNSMEQIHAHFDSIPSKKGTKIIIWNIRRSVQRTDYCDPSVHLIHIEDLIQE